MISFVLFVLAVAMGFFVSYKLEGPENDMKFLIIMFVIMIIIGISGASAICGADVPLILF